MADKVRENRLRRQADRLGLILHKSRSRRFHVDNQGGYMLADVDHGGAVAGWNYDFDLDDVEQWLTDYETPLRG